MVGLVKWDELIAYLPDLRRRSILEIFPIDSFESLYLQLLSLIDVHEWAAVTFGTYETCFMDLFAIDLKFR